jgi:hypothetical protein
MMRTIVAAALFASLLFTAPVRAQNPATANADDAARFLAGLQPQAGSPLSRLTEDPSWKQHANRFDTTFGNFENVQLAKIRDWSAANLTTSRSVLYYMFSGPDVLYANAFFPNASTYILAGLEPVGQVPDLAKLPRSTVTETLRNVQVSLGSILSVSYFITVNMKKDLNTGPVSGTMPILYVFLARSGKTIRNVSLVNLDEHGVLQPAETPGVRPTARGVKIVFSGSDEQLKTLYYFSVSLLDEPRGIVFLKYLRQQARGDSFIKSASYLMHTPGFTQTRNFLLEHSELLLQDDSGIPIASFDVGKWQLHPHGRYVGPISIFQEHHQSKLTELYQRKPSRPIDFGIGYMSRFSDSNLLLAIRNPGAPDLATPVLIDAAPHRTAGGLSALQRPKFPGHPGDLKVQEEKEVY